jgi:hypothetical protein
LRNASATFGEPSTQFEEAALSQAEKSAKAHPVNQLFDEEQCEILQMVDETTRTEERRRKIAEPRATKKSPRPARRWHEFNGDVVCRVVAKFLENHLKSCHLKVVGPHVFVNDFPDEFDLLVVDSDADPSEYTNSYTGEKVSLVLEVKKRGAIASRKEFKKRLRTLGHTFKRLAETLHTSCAYLTIEETYKTNVSGSRKRKRKIYYLEETKKILESKGFWVFCLRHSQTKAPKQGEWKIFVETVQQLRRPHET